ncbi:MAG: hypothetical protein IJ764_03530 [Bacteroidales bacterium]|nr:hypothetical protein [Bacteroidales bacterium]
MIPTLMYIHGYGSGSNALKCQQLRKMFPDYNVVAPDFDYDSMCPDDIQNHIRQSVIQHHVRLIVGSSLGGYHALCATAFFDGIVWCVNPVCHVTERLPIVMERVVANHPELRRQAEQMQAFYADFDRRVFQQLPQRQGQLYFALSTDDEVLGSHSSIVSKFPYASVHWRDHAAHRFTPFPELKSLMLQSLNA